MIPKESKSFIRIFQALSTVTSTTLFETTGRGEPPSAPSAEDFSEVGRLDMVACELLSLDGTWSILPNLNYGYGVKILDDVMDESEISSSSI